jgi:ATP/maltotriose-dependent transcriptional regulator MalT
LDSPNTWTPGTRPFIGRRPALRAFSRSIDAVREGTFQLIGLVGEPGVGKSRLLGEFASLAAKHGLTVLSGRASEFEQDIPFGVIVDALEDHLDLHGKDLAERIGTEPTRLLGTVFPTLTRSADQVAPGEAPMDPGQVRYRLHRTIRRLLDELAEEPGLVVILDDLHWADDSSIDVLDHLVRHPPHAPVLMVAAFRPAQASPRLASLMSSPPGSDESAMSREITVEPLTEDEVVAFLDGRFGPARSRELHNTSQGNPFYLEALIRMNGTPGPTGANDLGEDLPGFVRASLEVELNSLSPTTLLLARAASVAADDFAPSLAAVAAEMSTADALSALDELVARDVVRPNGARFEFRHPLVRRAAYVTAAAGWRVAAHARLARHLAEIGASATVRAHHVESSAEPGDGEAIETLIAAAEAIEPTAPGTAARWLTAALRLLPEDSPQRLGLLIRLAQAQTLSGRLETGSETVREAIRLLPADDYERRVHVVRLCAMIERLLGRPAESRALLLTELRRLPDPLSRHAIPLRLRLVAESLMRADFRAAQAVLDLIPETEEGRKPSIDLAIASLRPVPAFAAGRIPDALRYLAKVDELLATAPDSDLAEWMDSITWLCWCDTTMGRYQEAAPRFERALAVARGTGQTYIVTTILSGQAHTLRMLGRLTEAAEAAQEAAEIARLLKSGQSMAFALTQQSLIATWTGDNEAALRLGDEAVQGSTNGEWWGAMARFARAYAVLRSGRQEDGMAELTELSSSATLDRTSRLSSYQLLARAEAELDHPKDALRWAERADRVANPLLVGSLGSAQLTRAFALGKTEPVEAADHARAAVKLFDATGQRVDAGRALLHAGRYARRAGDRSRAREDIQAAVRLLADCHAHGLQAEAIREQRRLGVRGRPEADAGSRGARENRPFGLSRRELEVASLAAEGCTNSEIASRLFLSVRTVETHLTRIFNKMGVNSRVGLANALREQ